MRAAGGVIQGKAAELVQVALQFTTLENAKSAVLLLVVLHYARSALRALRANGISGIARLAYERLSRFMVAVALLVPANRRRMNREMAQALRQLEESLVSRTTVPTIREVPTYGRTPSWVDAQMASLERLDSAHVGDEDADGRSVWRAGRVSGAVYHGGDELSEIIGNSVRRFLLANPLHPEVFPGLRKMEAEVVEMVLRMYNAPPDGAGTTTSGGTESILMACKTMRDWGRAERRIKHPEIVIPTSAHVAFDKAGHYFGITVRRVPVDRLTRKVRIESVERAITPNTVMVVGSAPNFPDGIIDDIVALAGLARRHRIGCHVDACLGSFLVPYLERAGYVAEPFDFRVDGVTSISCDTHKYGFAPKGSSVVMYRSAELRRYQYYVNVGWVGGVYASPTIAGSRPGALIAGTWATMVHLGQNGYTESCRAIVGAAKTIEQRVRDEIPELTVLGKPLVSVVAIASAGSINIYDVGDQMGKRGWHLNALTGDVPAFHIACTRLTVPVVDLFISDLKAAVEMSRSRPAKPGQMAAVYGLGTTGGFGPHVIGQLATHFVDTLYKVK